MSRENAIDNFTKFLNGLHVIGSALKDNDDNVKSVDINGVTINIDNLTQSNYQVEHVAPGLANFIETVVKTAKFNTEVTGSYESDSLNLSESLISVETDYGS